jgi:hypothetical protein
MKAKDLDKKFDDGDFILDQFDLNTIRKPMLDQKRVNIDFPVWVIQSLDEESRRLGVTRQSLIKVWIAEKLENKEKNKKEI